MKNKKILIIVVSFVIVAALIFFFADFGKGIEVTTQSVEKGNLEKYVEELGTVKMLDEQIIYASVSGYISDFFFDVGDPAQEGERVLNITSSETRANLLQKNKLEEEIKIAERNLIENQEMLDKNKTLMEAGALSSKEYQDFTLMVQNEESRLENLKKDLSYTNTILWDNQIRVSAPLCGLIIDKYVNLGDFVFPGTPLLMIGDPDTKYIESDILVTDIVDINEGDKVIIYNKNLNIEAVEGVIAKIYPSAFSKLSDLGVEQKRVKVEIDILEESEQIKPGFEFDLNIVTESHKEALFIPNNAIFKLDGQDYVFVVENSKSYLRKVVSGIDSDQNTEIIEGLSEGEEVITIPPSELEDGSKVIIK